MRPALGAKRAGHQIDEGGLARAVGPDQRVARAALEAELDVVGDRERAEALAETARLEGGGAVIARPAALRQRSTRSQMPSMPPRAKHHDQHQQQADPEIPVGGIQLGEAVLRDHVERRADEGAVEPPDAAEDQHDQHVPERSKPSTSSATNCVVCASSAPATPASAAAIV